MSPLNRVEIRESVTSDWPLIEALYPAAFPEEDLMPLVRALLRDESVALSLVGIAGSSLAGHVIFTRCAVAGRSDHVALLGPLAVLPSWQRQGVGTALVRGGLKRLKHEGTTRVFVLGDPAYYGRFGFAHETDVDPPYALPAEWRLAWQSLGLRTGGSPGRRKLSVPQPWLQPSLWAP